ncbi:APC family permease [Allobranchiibius sp. GilTou38]|uniref:APC family permease n=1 Tax=Allobranchiibius sp. GilTou38 TaxID=2815210 RepID=UPI001AA0E766|nr:APC family permease [Allobranchiibius sp. GilTou38]MBO1765500.1 APC family permease [Allobranchiibius sp. GilTou38]
MTTAPPKPQAEGQPGQLQRSVGFYGLMFVSLGSIIGSGWLLGALNASKLAGPAAILTWVIGAAMLALLALVYAELGATYPVAGGSGRFAFYSHGPVAGFLSGWASWLQAVFIAPIEVLAALAYVNSVSWVDKHFPLLHDGGPSQGLLNARGVIIAILLMILFTGMNLAGAKFMSDSNSIVVIWKAAVPLLAIGVIATTSFHGGNFTAGGGFMPHGMHGVFAALTGGVVFALQGFEQAVQLAGEARDPKRDISRAVLVAMGIGALIYTALQVVFIAGVSPSHVAKNWDNPLKAGDYGAYYTLAIAIGATWLATVLIIDAVVSPAGTGIVYVGTSARLSYAIGTEREMPTALAKTDRRGVPWVSILVAAVIGIAAFGPFKSWNELVNVVTGATAIMYAFAPVALASLHKNDPTRTASYTAPMPKILLPAAFCSANLIIYWGGFEYTWKLLCAMVVGLLLFGIGSTRHGGMSLLHIKRALWIAPWLAGQFVICFCGRYGAGAKNYLPNWIDILVVIVFSLAIFYLAVNMSQSTAEIERAVESDRAHDPLEDLVTS